MIWWTRSPSDGLLAGTNFSVGVSTEIEVAVKESSRPVKKPTVNEHLPREVPFMFNY